MPISNLPGNPSPVVIGVDNGLVIAHDSAGNYLNHTVIRSSTPLLINAIATDNRGDIYLTGCFSGTADFRGNGPSPITVTTTRNKSLFVAKLDAALRGVWVKADTNAQFSEGKGIQLYFDQAFVVGNHIGSFSIDSLILPVSTTFDGLVFRLDANTAQIAWGQAIIGLGIDCATSLAVDFNHVFVGGYYTSDTLHLDGGTTVLPNLNAGTADIYVASYRADSGFIDWAQRAGGTSEDVCNDVSVDYQRVYATGAFSGNCSFGGNTLNSLGGTDCFLWGLNRLSGTHDWVAQDGGTGNDVGKAVDVDEVGNVVLVGEFRNTALFGGSVSLTATGMASIFCTTYQGVGSPTSWAIQAGNLDDVYVNAVDAGHFGIFLAGQYENSSLGFVGPGTVTLPAAAFSNYFLSAIQCGPLYSGPAVLQPGSDSLCVGSIFDIFLFNAQAGLNYALYDATADTVIDLQSGSGGMLQFVSPPLFASLDFNLVAIDPSNPRCQQLLNYTFVHVSPYPQPFLGADTLFCTGDSVILRPAGGPYDTYSWGNGSMLDSLTVTQGGSYFVDVKNGFGCSSSDTIIIAEISLPALQVSDNAACPNDTAVFYNPFPGIACLWSDNSIGDSIALTTPARYWVELSQGPCRVRDSFQLFVFPVALVNLGPDTVLCPGSTLLLDPTDDSGNYVWSTGATDTTLSVILPGSYGVSVTNSFGCTGVDQLNVAYEPPILLFVGTTQTIFCEFDPPLPLLPFPPGGQLSGDITPGDMIDPGVLGTGNFSLQYAYTSPAGCSDTMLHGFLVVPAPTTAFAGPDQILTNNNPVQLAANAPFVGVGTWSSPASGNFDNLNFPNAVVSGLPAGTIPLVWTVSTPFCGSSSDTVLITVPPFIPLRIPTGFSPNGDGFNDTWQVAGLEAYAQRQLKVFNRWGAAVYENSTWANDWDARNNGGTELPDDTYYYVLDLGAGQEFAGYLVIKR
jgi:gliding motility-associated-like protein